MPLQPSAVFPKRGYWAVEAVFLAEADEHSLSCAGAPSPAIELEVSFMVDDGSGNAEFTIAEQSFPGGDLYIYDYQFLDDPHEDEGPPLSGSFSFGLELDEDDCPDSGPMEVNVSWAFDEDTRDRGIPQNCDFDMLRGRECWR